jgi:murein DD-endopeptidase MepM/ murein hydrolase activator NlpD
MPEFALPTNLPCSSPYGPRGGGFHFGVDYSDGVEGHEICSVGDGEVVYSAFEEGGLGHTVTVLHAPGMKSGYGHMRGPAIVNVGDRVARGQVLGHVGNTGSSRGAHLHLWMGENTTTESINPAAVLSPFEGDDMTVQELTDLLAQWEQDTRKVILDTLAQWEQDTRKLLVEHIDAKFSDLQTKLGV